MITTIRFDVHGRDAVDIGDRAIAQLAKFCGEGLQMGDWTVDIDVHEEAKSAINDVGMWRGEVTARRHDGHR